MNKQEIKDFITRLIPIQQLFRIEYEKRNEMSLIGIASNYIHISIDVDTVSLMIELYGMPQLYDDMELQWSIGGTTVISLVSKEVLEHISEHYGKMEEVRI